MSSNLKESESHVSSELQISKHPKSQAGHDKLSQSQAAYGLCWCQAIEDHTSVQVQQNGCEMWYNHSHCHSCFQFVFPRYNMVLTWYNHNIHNCFQIFQYHSSCSSPTFYDTWLFRIGAVECRGDLMQRATSGSRHLVIEWLTLQPTISGCIEMYRKTS
jgi:hypothetical protein